MGVAMKPQKIGEGGEGGQGKKKNRGKKEGGQDATCGEFSILGQLHREIKFWWPVAS